MRGTPIISESLTNDVRKRDSMSVIIHYTRQCHMQHHMAISATAELLLYKVKTKISGENIA